jgi:4,5-DOPA dioxygenase extradiol
MSVLPVLFVGHGSPLNAIENNAFTATWRRLGEEMERPKVILSISAHWYTRGTKTSDAKAPRLIYDMYGFDEKLYHVRYDAPGAPELVPQIRSLVPGNVQIDNQWGIDHGTWSVMVHMFPKADIPIIQLSVDLNAPPDVHYKIGRSLQPLRNQGVLILGSGNVVHNLHRISWDVKDGYPWAKEFDAYIKEAILSGRHEDVIQFRRAGPSAEEAFYTPDHYYPLLYALGASAETDGVTVYNEACVMGSLSMTGYLFA